MSTATIDSVSTSNGLESGDSIVPTESSATIVNRGVEREVGEAPPEPRNAFNPPPLVVDEDVEQTKMDFFVPDTDPHHDLWVAYGDLSGKAQGETQDRFRAYVESAYILRELERKAVNDQGDHYKREIFIRKASNVQMAAGVSLENSSEKEINRKLTAYGIVSLLRSKVSENIDSPEPVRTTPKEAPGDDFYGGNLNRVTLLALAPLVKSTSKSQANTGVTTYAWKHTLGEKLAKDIIDGLRNCMIPRSDRYVSDLVKKHEAAVVAYEASKKKKIDPVNYDKEEQRRLHRERDKKIGSLMSRILTAADSLREECDLTDEVIRDKLIETKTIPRIVSRDVMSMIATEEARTPVVEAVAQQGVTETDAFLLTQHTTNRVALLESIAKTITESDAKVFGQWLCERHKTDPSVLKVALALRQSIAPVLGSLKPDASKNGKPNQAAVA